MGVGVRGEYTEKEADKIFSQYPDLFLEGPPTEGMDMMSEYANWQWQQMIKELARLGPYGERAAQQYLQNSLWNTGEGTFGESTYGADDSEFKRYMKERGMEVDESLAEDVVSEGQERSDDLKGEIETRAKQIQMDTMSKMMETYGRPDYGTYGGAQLQQSGLHNAALMSEFQNNLNAWQSKYPAPQFYDSPPSRVGSMFLSAISKFLPGFFGKGASMMSEVARNSENNSGYQWGYNNNGGYTGPGGDYGA